jgi:hypothetical protein
MHSNIKLSHKAVHVRLQCFLRERDGTVSGTIMKRSKTIENAQERSGTLNGQGR